MAVDIALSWSLSPTSTSNVDGQRIYRATGSSPSFPADYTEIASLGDSVTTYTDSGVATGTTYSYAVTAFNSAGESAPTTTTVSTPIVVSPSPVELSFEPQGAFISAARLIEPDPVTLQFDTPTPFVAADLKPIQPDPVELELATPNALIQPFLFTDEWQIDRERIRPSELEATAEALSLSFEVGRDNLDIWREYDRAGDLTTESGFGGAFRAIGRNGDDDIEVRAPFTRLRPFRPSADYRVAGYDESQLSPSRFEITLELQRVTNRSEGFPELSQTGVWELALQHGTVGLSDRQVGQVDREGAPAGATLTLPLLVSDDQAAALLDNLGYPGGVVERSVPDGPDQRVDESGGRQTVTLSAPEGAAVDSGDWFVTDWTLSFNAYSEDRQWLVELALAR